MSVTSGMLPVVPAPVRLAALRALRQVPDRIGGLDQGVRAVDHREVRPGVDDLQLDRAVQRRALRRAGELDEQDLPRTLDRYVLREFLKILMLVILSVIALFIIVEYTEMAGSADSSPARTKAGASGSIVYFAVIWLAVAGPSVLSPRVRDVP